MIILSVINTILLIAVGLYLYKISIERKESINKINLNNIAINKSYNESREFKEKTINSMIKLLISEKLSSVSASKSAYGMNFHSTDDSTIKYTELTYDYDKFIVLFKDNAGLDIVEKRKPQQGGFPYIFNGRSYDILFETIVNKGIESVKVSIIVD
jgi:type II secretory ATPase GspE/PulE/Tfp pilus assembly ATPase PilB-like protein